MIAGLILTFLLIAAADLSDVLVVHLPTKGSVNLVLGTTGRAEVKREGTLTRVKLEIERMQPASASGPLFNVYVAWAVSPEGVCENLGQIAMDRDKGRLEATTRLEHLGILVTAEPHDMVDLPSKAVALRSQETRGATIRKSTVSVSVGDYDYSAVQVPAAALPPAIAGARVAFQYARVTQADQWAEAEFRNARVAFDTMEEMLARSSPYDIVTPFANETTRKSQQAIIAARQKRSAAMLETAREENSRLSRENSDLLGRVQTLTQQHNTAVAQVQKLQTDVTSSNREIQRMVQDRDEAVARERVAVREAADLKRKQDELQNQLTLTLRAEFYDEKAKALTQDGRDALSRLAGIAQVVPGQVRLEGSGSDVLFEAARQHLIRGGIPYDRIVLRR